MTGVLLDTHVWFWYLVGSRRLPVRIRRAIERSAGNCWLSPISVWELGMLVDRDRIRLHSSYRAWVTEAFERLPLREAPLSFDVALRSREIVLPTKDPADHFLAATALTHDLRLATVDRHLLAATWLPTV